MGQGSFEYPRVEPDDPRRCQGNDAHGQCRIRAVEGGTYCPIHGGSKQLEKIQKAAVRDYRLGQWQARVEEFGDSSQVKSLRAEIGILRLMMEERMRMINDATDLLLQSGPISDLVLKIEKVVTSCHKLEGSMGQLLDKQAVLQFANVVIGIIGEELVTQPEVVGRVADRIIAAINTKEQE